MTFDPSQFIDAQGNPTDPSLVKFAQALRTTESGGDFTAKGKSGEHGAYQWMPGNYEAGAKQFGVDPTDFSAPSQNKVAYLQLAQMKADGLQPYQMASKWNSGSADNWQSHSGTNSQGVNYDTPGYVKKVMDNFVAMRGGGATQTQNGPVQAAPQLTPDQQKDQTSAQQTGAWFPASSTDNGLTAGLKAAGNLIPSAFNFAKGALDTINPLKIAGNIAQIPGAFNALAQESGGYGNALKAFGSELLPTAYNMLVPEAGRDLIAGDIQGAGRAVTNDPFGQVAPFVFGAKALAGGIDSATSAVSKARTASYVDNIAENTAKGVPIPKDISTNFGGAIDTGISKAAGTVTKPISYAFGKAADIGGAMTKYGVAKTTGLEPSTIDLIKNNPDQFTPEAISSMSRKSLGEEVSTELKGRSADVAETGKEYAPFREGASKVKVDPSYIDKTIEDTTGLKVKKGTLMATGKSSIRDAGDIRALQQVYNLWKPEFKKGYLTSDEYLNFRADLGKMAGYGRELTKSKPLQNLSDIIRGKFNTAYRSQLPGLEELDKQFGPAKQDLSRLSKDFIDPKTGELKDAAINRIANATGKGKDALIAKLEEIKPGITQRIRILKAVEDIQNIHKVGTYTKATLEGGGLVGGIATMNIPLIAGSIVAIILTQPEVAVRMIRGYGKYAAPLAGKVLEMLKKGGGAVNNLPNTRVGQASVFGRQQPQLAQPTQ